MCIMVLFLHPVCLQAVDLSKPIDKRIYKGTQPTCHDFNQYSATAESVALIVGFSAGQVQYLDPIKKETSKLFNEEVFVCICRHVLVFLCLGVAALCVVVIKVCHNTTEVICHSSHRFCPSQMLCLESQTLLSHSFTVSSELALPV